MNEKNQEVLEVIVKPGWQYLNVVNEINEWLYKILNMGEKLCEVKKWSDDTLKLSWSTYRAKPEDANWGIELKRDPSVSFSDRRVNVDWHVEKKQVVWDGSNVYWTDFESYSLTSMDWIIELDNWKFLINSYWKYQPNLSFINSVPEVKFKDEDKETFNLPEWSFSVVYWDFFISKKWTKCFRILPKEKAKHILICDDRGWAFNKYRWRTLPEEWSLYYRRASSNGWWRWSDYGIYPIDWKYALSEEDI